MLILLDVVIGVLVVLNVVGPLLGGMGESVPVAVPVVGTVVIGASWALWRATGWRWWLMGVAAAVAPATLTGGGGLGILLLMLAITLVMAEFGLRWTVVWIVVQVGFAVVLMVSLRVGRVEMLVQAAAVALLAGLGLLLGQVLRELTAERRTNLRLLDELRASHHVETELMLADERARSARELHDGLGHRLTLIGLSLEYAGRMRDRDPAKAYAEVDHARAQASDALAYMRRWVRALNPPRETALTGVAAFDAIADSFRGTGLTVSVQQSGTERPLGRQASLFAHRLVQEGLTNVLRHSPADEVDLRIGWGTDDVTITLADNGITRGGAIATDIPAGFGLRSLAERAEQLGGSFAARVDARGMVLTGRVPDRADEPARRDTP